MWRRGGGGGGGGRGGSAGSHNPIPAARMPATSRRRGVPAEEANWWGRGGQCRVGRLQQLGRAAGPVDADGYPGIGRDRNNTGRNETTHQQEGSCSCLRNWSRQISQQ